jgi:hypothetical protein
MNSEPNKLKYHGVVSDVSKFQTKSQYLNYKYKIGIKNIFLKSNSNETMMVDSFEAFPFA